MVKLALILVLNACAPPTVAPVADDPCMTVDCEHGLVCDAGECVEPCGDDVCEDNEECVIHEQELPSEGGYEDHGYEAWWQCDPV